MSFKAVKVQRGADLDHLSKSDPASTAGLNEKLNSNWAELRDSLFSPEDYSSLDHVVNNDSAFEIAVGT